MRDICTPINFCLKFSFVKFFSTIKIVCYVCLFFFKVLALNYIKQKNGLMFMKKKWKIIITIMIILLISVLFSVLVNNQYIANLNFMDPAYYPLIGQWIPIYLFWSSIFFICCSLIAILIILFLPNNFTEILLKDSGGKLILKREGIEGLVKSSVQEFSFADISKSKVKLSNKKIKIKLFGDLKQQGDTIEKTNELTNKVKNDIQNFLGITNQIDIHVIFNQLEPKSSKKRVQ